MTVRDIKPEAHESLDYEAFLDGPRVEPWRLVHLMSLIVLAALVLWMYKISGDLIVSTVFAIVLALTYAGGSLWASRTSARRDSLLLVLSIAAEKGMPLAPAVAAFGSQFSGSSRHSFFRLASLLNSGASLSESIASVPAVFSSDAALLARVGEDAGVLPRALRVAASARTSYLPAASAIASQISYILVVLIALQCIMGYLAYFIVPKMRAIFRDFNYPVPEATAFVFDISNQAMNGWFFVTASILLVEVIFLIIIPIKLLGGMDLDFPWIDRVFRRRHTALVLRALSLVVEGGKPIESGLESLSRNYPTDWVRRRLRDVHDEVRRGEDWCTSLWRRGLIRVSDGALLSAAGASGNLAWALRELADTSERRMLVHFQAAVQLIFPVVIISLGLVVLVVAVAYFGPLVQIIHILSDI